jgi:hypothetical protein
MDSKTTAEIEDKVRAGLAKNPGRLDFSVVIHTNQIRVRLVNGGSRGRPNVIGFVHNPDPGAADVLLDVTEMLLGLWATEYADLR